MIRFDEDEHHFFLEKTADKSKALEYPLSVSLQVTRECNLKCVYCSEVGEIPTPSLENIRVMVSNLKGVKRIILTGGEPLIRRDIFQITDYVKNMGFEVISIATNGVLISSYIAKKLKSNINYFDVTIDGTRKIHNKIRGCYDEIINGICILRNFGIPFSIVTVLYDENVQNILYMCQIADVLGARKLKILTPINKGRGKDIINRSLTSKQLLDVFTKIRNEKEQNGWTPRITLVDWDKVGEGHVLLIHPNGDVAASPVPSKENCVHIVGNVLENNIKDVWDNYPYKDNHLRKYVEESLYVC